MLALPSSAPGETPALDTIGTHSICWSGSESLKRAKVLPYTIMGD